MKYSRRSKTRKSKRKPRRKLKRKSRRKLQRNTRSKRRRRKQLVKRQQKGGMFINLSPANVARFRKNPHTLNKDCCPCVFHFFGMPLQLVEDLKKKFGKTGMQPQQIITVFKKAYPTTLPNGRGSPTKWTMFQEQISPDALIRLYGTLGPNQGLVGGLEDRSNKRHCVIFAKNTKSENLLIDAQNSILATGDTEIGNYLRRYNVKTLFALSGKNSVTGQNLKIDSMGNIH